MAKPKKPKQVADSHPLAIHCVRHGVTPCCLICRHLGEGSGLGYFAIKPEAEEAAQAWCAACDTVLEAERGWSDRADAQADWKLYCTGCWDEALARHQLRSWLRGTRPEDFQ